MRFEGRLKALEALAEANKPVVPVPMSDEDFIPHGILGRQIVATINMLGIMREIAADDPELIQSTDEQIAYLRCREIKIWERGKVSRELSEEIGEMWGFDQRQTMPPEVFKEMTDSCREKRLPRHVEVSAIN